MSQLSPDVYTLLEDWLQLGQVGHPLFPDNMHKLRERTRIVLERSESASNAKRRATLEDDPNSDEAS